MSDEPNGGLRRFGRRDRKDKLTSGPLFPDEDKAAPQPATDDSDDPASAKDELPPDETETPAETESLQADEPLLEDEAQSEEDSAPDVVPEFDAQLAADTSAIEGTELAESLPVSPRYPPASPDEVVDVVERFPMPGDARPDPQAAEAPPVPTARSRGDWRHNLIAFVFFVATIGLCGVYSIIWNNPWTPLNPLAPPTSFYVITETPDPFAAANATATAAVMVTETPVQPLGSLSGLPFSIADSGVVYVPNSNSNGCDWASIAGTVTGLEGEPLTGYRIRILDAGDPNARPVEIFSGSAPTFGESGFELPLGNAPRAGRYDVQLLNPSSVPLSDAFRIVTRATCEENVAIVSFVQVGPM